MQLEQKMELTFEERVERRLAEGDAMMRLLEQDNSMCLYALKALANRLQADEVETELSGYIKRRGQLLDDIRSEFGIARRSYRDEKTDPGIATDAE